MTSTFKELDLIDRVPEELRMEVCNTVWEAVIKIISRKRNVLLKCCTQYISKFAQWLSEEALQIAVKRREAKSKGEKERYKHLNAEFQRLARRDKKAFLSDQCKEIEENNRMGKTGALFKKRKKERKLEIPRVISSKDGHNKGLKRMDLMQAEDIEKRWQEYTEELYKKDLYNQDNHDGVVSHLEPYILECEVMWALESITTNTASGGDGIPIELF